MSLNPFALLIGCVVRRSLLQEASAHRTPMAYLARRLPHRFFLQRMMANRSMGVLG